ncbi:hypothetical protein [Bradyrhizobium sp. WSM1743]|uniref:hypothetical protein n=1 Tax=Bradyrhizobium sp. WSM1743 TaxID=318996 RepID=UPI0004812806|nr:hypothetical protein [Bradyrhizobium sp. WSM1743]
MTGFGAATHIAKIEKGATVTVIGCGAVGLSAVQGARLAGASRIIGVDRQREKLESLRSSAPRTRCLPMMRSMLRTPNSPMFAAPIA